MLCLFGLCAITSSTCAGFAAAGTSVKAEASIGRWRRGGVATLQGPKDVAQGGPRHAPHEPGPVQRLCNRLDAPGGAMLGATLCPLLLLVAMLGSVLASGPGERSVGLALWVWGTLIGFTCTS